MNEAFKHKRDYSLTGEQPKPTLEGPHWDKVVAHKTWHGLDEVDNCLLDLRSAVRELQKSNSHKV